jgi:hypothetical protein
MAISNSTICGASVYLWSFSLFVELQFILHSEFIKFPRAEIQIQSDKQ